MIINAVLTNTRAYIGSEFIDCDIAINDGKIFKIGKKPNMPSADVKINLKGLLVLPGLIDAHVHLRDEGKTLKEDFLSGTSAAAVGGFTTVLDMPNNEPVTMSHETLKNRMETAEKRIIVNVGFFSEFPPDKSEITNILREGAIGFKLFLANRVGGLDITNDNAISEAFEQVRRHQAIVGVHAEDCQLLEASIVRLKRDGKNDIEAYLEAHSEAVESVAIKRMTRIVRRIGNKLHFCHVSTRPGLTEICRAKRVNAVTCETTPHNLFLTTESWKSTSFRAVTMPPARDEHTRAVLWQGINEGSIDIIGSDHAPHTLQEKESESIWNVKTGIPGLETTLPLLLTSVNKRQLLIADVVRLMSRRPAEIFCLHGKGTISEGSSADLTVVNLKKRHKIDVSKFHSKAKFSPFDGWPVEGIAVKTFVNGNLVMDNGEIVTKEGSGQIVRRKTC